VPPIAAGVTGMVIGDNVPAVCVCFCCFYVLRISRVSPCSLPPSSRTPLCFSPPPSPE